MNSFDTIIGYEREKEELLLLSDVLKNENKYKALDVKVPRAILIYGEPGLGKTLMAECMIKEVGRKCFSCKKDRADGEFVSAIKKTFEEAIEAQPSIVLLDDMDKFAQDNLQEDSNKEEFVTIQSCLEDIKDKSVFVIATANDIDNIPKSLLRAGRFGRQLQVRVPKHDDTVKIIKHFLSSKKISSDVNPEMIAHILGGSSCAVLENVINEAGMYAAFENEKEISKNHIIKAILRVITKDIENESYDDEESKRILAYHEVGHAVIALKTGKMIGYLTIKPHGDVGGLCSSFDLNQGVFTYEDLRKRIICSLGGKASVEVFLGKTDLGAASDIENCAVLLRNNIEKVGIEGFDYIYDIKRYDSRQSPERLNKITHKISEELKSYYEESKKILKDNEKMVKELVDILVEKEIIPYDEILNFVKNFKE